MTASDITGNSECSDCISIEAQICLKFFIPKSCNLIYLLGIILHTCIVFYPPHSCFVTSSHNCERGIVNRLPLKKEQLATKDKILVLILSVVEEFHCIAIVCYKNSYTMDTSRAITYLLPSTQTQAITILVQPRSIIIGRERESILLHILLCKRLEDN